MDLIKTLGILILVGAVILAMIVLATLIVPICLFALTYFLVQEYRKYRAEQKPKG